jgi:hypothetical protein
MPVNVPELSWAIRLLKLLPISRVMEYFTANALVPIRLFIGTIPLRVVAIVYPFAITSPFIAAPARAHCN